MNVYVIKNKKGSIQFVYGDWVKARIKAADGVVKIVDWDKVDDVIYGDLSYDDLPVY